jgi:hypothetical protein
MRQKSYSGELRVSRTQRIEAHRRVTDCNLSATGATLSELFAWPLKRCPIA